MVLMCVWEARSYLRRLYSLRRELHHSGGGGKAGKREGHNELHTFLPVSRYRQHASFCRHG